MCKEKKLKKKAYDKKALLIRKDHHLCTPDTCIGALVSSSAFNDILLQCKTTIVLEYLFVVHTLLQNIPPPAISFSTSTQIHSCQWSLFVQPASLIALMMSARSIPLRQLEWISWSGLSSQLFLLIWRLCGPVLKWMSLDEYVKSAWFSFKMSKTHSVILV